MRMRSSALFLASFLVTASAMAQTETPLPQLPPAAQAPAADASPPKATEQTPVDSKPAPVSTAAPGPRIVYVDSPETAAKPPPPPRENTLSLGLFPLVRGFVQFAYQRRIYSWLGVGGLVGIGNAEVASSGQRIGFELTPQVFAYPIGSFNHGMQVGFEVDLLRSSGSTADNALKITSTSVSPGILAGYKVDVSGGFAIQAHLGLRLENSSLTVQSAGGQVRSSKTELEPLLRLNIGYSF
jgi:hypothetical protein